ncbi:MAG: thioredoxin family protein [Ignavibacteria bacterium]
MAYKFSEEFLMKSLSYDEYIRLTDRLLSEGKTTGENQEPEMIEYTKLNAQRMNRIYKTSEVKKEFKDVLKENQHWVLITEPWCGDAANSVPVIAKIAESSDKVKLHILFRDENPDVMNEYLTNGSKSIPMLIILDENYEEKHVWGPRPAEIQNMVLEFKKSGEFNMDELKKNLQLWYFNDKTHSTQKEIIELLKK